MMMMKNKSEHQIKNIFKCVCYSKLAILPLLTSQRASAGDTSSKPNFSEATVTNTVIVNCIQDHAIGGVLY